MCGIAGIVDFRKMEGDGGLSNILDSQVHRGPDNYGIWLSRDNICALGTNRLSIIDLSSAGNQPMRDPASENVISFNGEIYNFPALRKNLLKAGENFFSKTDTEVILALYRLHGEDFVNYLRGMFAVAIWDVKKRKLVLARDPMGEKPLNYSIQNGKLYFASEISPLMNHPAMNNAIDLQALELYFDLQYIPAPFSIYKDVKKIMPGSIAIFDENGFKERRYWNLDFTKKSEIASEVDAIDALEEKLREVVRMRLISDVPIGTTLSGGVDSSLVSALMAQSSDQPIKTFNVTFEDKKFDESQYANKVADIYSTDHHSIHANSNIIPLLRKMAYHFGEPFGDKGAVPAFQIAELARSKVTVALNGDGGDELLGGYPRYNFAPGISYLLSKADRWGDAHSNLEKANMLRERKDLMGRIERRYQMRFRIPEAQSLGPLSVNYWWNSLRDDLFGDAKTTTVFDWRLNNISQAIQHANHPIDRMLWLDSNLYLQNDGLVKTDIAAMHCSLEGRTPLVDHELIEFCAALPVSIKFKWGQQKYLLKKVAERHLPHSLIYRKKQGFSIPVKDWLLGPLKPMLKETLFNNELMQPLNTSVVKRVYNEFEQGRGSHSFRIWQLLNYGIWQDIKGKPY